MVHTIENTIIPPNCTLATTDVKSLHMKTHTMYQSPRDNEKLLYIVLTQNFFCMLTNVTSDTRNSNGHKDGPSLCQHIHGRTGRELLHKYHTKPIQKTLANPNLANSKPH